MYNNLMLEWTDCSVYSRGKRAIVIVIVVVQSKYYKLRWDFGLWTPTPKKKIHIFRVWSMTYSHVMYTHTSIFMKRERKLWHQIRNSLFSFHVMWKRRRIFVESFSLNSGAGGCLTWSKIRSLSQQTISIGSTAQCYLIWWVDIL